MPQYVVSSSRSSPYVGYSHSNPTYPSQPIVYSTAGSHRSHHGHGGYEFPSYDTSGYGTPLRRYASAGHGSPAYYANQSHGGYHRSRSRSHSHAQPAQVISVPGRSHSHRRRSTSRSRHHHSSSHPNVSYSHAGSSHGHGYVSDSGRHDYYRSHGTSLGDRLRHFFGMDYRPSSHRDSGRHHSNHRTRTGPWFFGSKDERGFVDDYGREVDHRGRPIHRF
ncbi:hypothetical protein BV22DRAFT_1028858 [Leucogyrophana mollusca]|uniref:Uncharacterized protein n=1 Tax=Leucogyrophana mollusca TaxID=85980 RepID=A0ACB8BXJ0_9AGAM|nr:hypothetical protein BV22DRAFT_1028858 [Leucogyrophana mollusca]